MTDDKLMRCPFCGNADLAMHPNDIAPGGAAMALDGSTAQYAHCDGCGAEGPQAFYGHEARAAWNRRADEPYLIWSNEHRAWWRPNRNGYTTFIVAAGRYRQADAVSICRDARGGWKEGEPPPEIPVREADALASAVPV